MPPHCDTLDEPVVSAARLALEAGDVDLVLPYAWEAGEDEIREAFDLVSEARKAGDSAAQVADLWFFETVVRIHRAGEGATYGGLKPAGLDHGPVIPLALRALETGVADELAEFLCQAIREQLKERLAAEMELQEKSTGNGVAATRRYVSAMLNFQVYSHKTWKAILEGPQKK